MHLYSLTIQKASGITAAVFGNFSAPKQQETRLRLAQKVQGASYAKPQAASCKVTTNTLHRY